MTSPYLEDGSCAKFDSDNRQFFRIILDETDRDEKLRLPTKFTRKYGSEISISVSLKVPNGAMWEVEVAKCVDGIWLQNGWFDFSKHYSLCHGSLLVFRYEGNGHFHVVIFDKCTCEISYPYGGPQGSKAPNGDGFEDHGMDEDDDDMSVEILNDNLPSKKTEARSLPPRNRPQKEMNSTSKDFEILDDIAPSIKTRVRSPPPSSRPQKKKKSSNFSITHLPTKSSGVKYEIPEPNLKVDSAKKSGERPTRMEVCESKETLHSEERANPPFRASSFKSQKPSFKVVMHPSYINGTTLSVPVKFCRKHLLNRSGDAILSVCHGKTWSVVFKQNPNPNLCSGWKKFANENNLEVGDECVFELVNQTNITFNVKISRHAQDAKAEPAPAKKSDKHPTRMEVCKSKQTMPSVEQASPPFRASSFKSEKLAFKVVMRPSYIYKTTLSLPVIFCRKHLLNRSGDAILNVYHGKTMSVAFKQNPNPRLCSGWTKFVKENNLEVDDKCVFELVNQTKITFNVKIIRHAQDAKAEPTTENDGCNRAPPSKQKSIPKETTYAPRRLTSFNSDSENPFFVITTQSRIAQVNMSYSFIKKHIEQDTMNFSERGGAVNLTLENGGKLWPAKVLLYHESRIAVLSTGWGAFAREKCIKAGQECALELINKEDAVLRVHIL